MLELPNTCFMSKTLKLSRKKMDRKSGAEPCFSFKIDTEKHMFVCSYLVFLFYF